MIPQVGKAYLHKGRPVFVTGGYYMGNRGVSNHWSYRVINPDGTLGEQGADYANSEDKFQTELPCELRVILKG